MHRRVLRWAQWALLAAVLIQGAALAACADDECHGIPFVCPGSWTTTNGNDFTCCCNRSVGGCCQYTCIPRRCDPPDETQGSVLGVSVTAPNWPNNIHGSPSTCADPPGTCTTGGGGGGD
jgi:hypothetical protein